MKKASGPSDCCIVGGVDCRLQGSSNETGGCVMLDSFRWIGMPAE